MGAAVKVRATGLINLPTNFNILSRPKPVPCKYPEPAKSALKPE